MPTLLALWRLSNRRGSMAQWRRRRRTSIRRCHGRPQQRTSRATHSAHVPSESHADAVSPPLPPHAALRPVLCDRVGIDRQQSVQPACRVGAAARRPLPRRLGHAPLAQARLHRLVTPSERVSLHKSAPSGWKGANIGHLPPSACRRLPSAHLGKIQSAHFGSIQPALTAWRSGVLSACRFPAQQR